MNKRHILLASLICICLYAFAGEKRIKIDDQPEQLLLQDLPPEIIDNIIKQAVVSNFNEETKIESLATSIHNLHSVMRTLKATNTLFKDSLEGPRFINSLVKHIADTYNLSQACIALILGEPFTEAWLNQVEDFPCRKMMFGYACKEILDLICKDHDNLIINQQLIRKLFSYMQDPYENVGGNAAFPSKTIKKFMKGSFKTDDNNYIALSGNKLYGILRDGSIDSSFGNNGTIQIIDEKDEHNIHINIVDIAYPIGPKKGIAIAKQINPYFPIEIHFFDQNGQENLTENQQFQKTFKSFLDKYGPEILDALLTVDKFNNLVAIMHVTQDPHDSYHLLYLSQARKLLLPNYLQWATFNNLNQLFILYTEYVDAGEPINYTKLAALDPVNNTFINSFAPEGKLTIVGIPVEYSHWYDGDFLLHLVDNKVFVIFFSNNLQPTAIPIADNDNTHMPPAAVELLDEFFSDEELSNIDEYFDNFDEQL